MIQIQKYFSTILRRPFYGLTAVAIFAPLVLFVANVATASEHQVTVSGACTRQVTTDRGSITLTSDVRDDNLKNAIRKASRQYDRAVDSIKKLKLENMDLQTTEYNVGEVREWENNKSVFKGYRARVGLTVSTSDIQRLSEVMEVGAREEIREVGRLTTFLSSDKIRKEQELCLKEAAENARSKADKLAASLGARLGSVIAISESNVSTPAPIMPMRGGETLMESKMTSAPSGVEGGKQEVSATVTASFEIK
jgi:uncharacterized protein YggE